MATLSDVTIEQLRALTVTQLRNAIKNKVDAMSKVQLIRLILGGTDFDKVVTMQDNPVQTYYPDGQVKSKLVVNRDVLGAKVGSKRWDFAYYDKLSPRPIKEVIHTELDASDVVVGKKVIQYFTDGQQPVVVSGG